MGPPLRFQVSGQQPVLIRNREYGNTELRERGQEAGMTDGDQIYAYDLSLNRTVYDCSITNVNKIDRDLFQAFFDDQAKGLFTPFTMMIPQLEPIAQGSPAPIVITGARFLSPALTWSEDDEGWWAVRFSIYTQQEGPTGPPV